MQTTPWRGSNCRDPCCRSSTTGYRQPATLGFFQTNLEILVYSFSRIITTKFLWLAWLAIKEKSLKSWWRSTAKSFVTSDDET